jgi:hypothetical protein
LCHTSQSETTMGSAASSATAHDSFVEYVDGRLREAGEPFGLARAETFKRLTP